MRGLRLENVTVAGVPGSLTFAVPIAQVRPVVVPSSRIRTVADVVVGLKPPLSGRVIIDDWPVTGEHHRRHQHGIRLVPSDGGLLPNLTVLRNILYKECVVERRPSEYPEKEVRHSTAVEYGLNDVLDRYPYEITVGRRRIAGLAKAMRADPSVVVLEDDLEAPTWTALLGVAQPSRDGGSAHAPHAPYARHASSVIGAGRLAGVAAVLITSDPARTYGLDGPPSTFHTETSTVDVADERDVDD